MIKRNINTYYIYIHILFEIGCVFKFIITYQIVYKLAQFYWTFSWLLNLINVYTFFYHFYSSSFFICFMMFIYLFFSKLHALRLMYCTFLGTILILFHMQTYLAFLLSIGTHCNTDKWSEHFFVTKSWMKHFPWHTYISANLEMIARKLI